MNNVRSLVQADHYSSDPEVGSLYSEPMLAEYPKLVAYLARCLARPGFKKALDAQMADFTGAPPEGWTGPQ